MPIQENLPNVMIGGSHATEPGCAASFEELELSAWADAAKRAVTGIRLERTPDPDDLVIADGLYPKSIATRKLFNKARGMTACVAHIDSLGFMADSIPQHTTIPIPTEFVLGSHNGFTEYKVKPKVEKSNLPVSGKPKKSKAYRKMIKARRKQR